MRSESGGYVFGNKSFPRWLGLTILAIGLAVVASGLSVRAIGLAARNASADPGPVHPLSAGEAGFTSLYGSVLISDTTSVYLPVVNRNNRQYQTGAIGSASLVKELYACDLTTGESCLDLLVTCPTVIDPITVTLKVGEPTGSVELQGTIQFFSGFNGSYYWDVTAWVRYENGEPVLVAPPLGPGGDSLQELTEYQEIIADLRANGFRTVQVNWKTTWFDAEDGVEEGMGKLSCRPASIMKWVYDNLHGGRVDQPFCADGHSNGASQVAYSLTRYGMAKYVDLAVFESGPNWTYMDQGCIQDDPAYSDIWAPDGARKNLDWSFGFPNDGSGPCAKKLKNYRTVFQSESLGLGNWQFSYPKTMMAFFFGAQDTSSPITRNQGIRFSDLLVTNASPLWSRVDLPNTGHNIGGTAEGQLALLTTLKNECKVR